MAEHACLRAPRAGVLGVHRASLPPGALKDDDLLAGKLNVIKGQGAAAAAEAEGVDEATIAAAAAAAAAARSGAAAGGGMEEGRDNSQGSSQPGSACWMPCSPSPSSM